MNEYLHNRLMKYIAPKDIKEVLYKIPYEKEKYVTNTLSPQEIEEMRDERLKLNFAA